MQKVFAIGFALLGMLSLAGCKPGTYYPMGHKVYNADSTTQTVYYVPPAGRAST